MNILPTHPRPINLQAAKVFWKAPWWAQLPAEDKQELSRIPVKLEDIVDLTKPPPLREGNAHCQIEDWRGCKVKHKKGGTVALVLGYAYAREFYRNKGTFKEYRWSGTGWMTIESRAKERAYEHRWYAYFNGKVAIIISRRWRVVGNYERITFRDDEWSQPSPIPGRESSGSFPP